MAAPGPAQRRGVAAGQFFDHRGELGDVDLVARVGVRQQRDPAVAGGDQPESDDAQVVAFLLGLAPRRDRRPVVARVDERREVGHVQDQRLDLQAEHLDHPPGQRRLDLFQLLHGDRVHRVPEPAVIQRPDPDPGDPAQRGPAPPVGERPFGAGLADPVHRRQPQVGAHRHPTADLPTPEHGVDHRDRVQLGQHPPHRRDVAELAVLGLRQAGISPRRRRGQPGDHLVLGAQVHLIHDPRPTLHSGRRRRVQVGPPAATLLDDRGHNYG